MPEKVARRIRLKFTNKNGRLNSHMAAWGGTCDVAGMNPEEPGPQGIRPEAIPNHPGVPGSCCTAVPRLKAIIFDLDNCLGAANEPGDALFEPAFSAMREANRGWLKDQTLEEAFSDCWRHALDFVAQKHGFSQAMLTAGWEALRGLEVTTPMRGYGDLQVLKEINLMRFLVTSGFRRLQESKIRALGIGSWFTRIYVDAIDEPGRKGKQGIFFEILAEYSLCPSEVLVAGDNADSEIQAGCNLGMETVQILRPGVSVAPNATWQVHDLFGVKKLVHR